MWAIKANHAEINPSLTAPLLRGGLGDGELKSPLGEGVRRRKQGGRVERGAAGGSAGQGELMTQVPYHDLGQRARILYEDAVAEVEAARQRESECRADIARQLRQLLAGGGGHVGDGLLVVRGGGVRENCWTRLSRIACQTAKCSIDVP